LKGCGNDSEATPLSEYKILVKVKGTPDQGETKKTGFKRAITR